MSHQEKQRIFDEYAKSKVFISWDHLVNSCNNYELLNHTFAACDLVQEEQQKLIAENASIEFSQDDQSFFINKSSIINPENKIQ